jgi:hypothetical protein
MIHKGHMTWVGLFPDLFSVLPHLSPATVASSNIPSRLLPQALGTALPLLGTSSPSIPSLHQASPPSLPSSSTGILNSGFALAKQVLYHLIATSSVLFCFSYFSARGSGFGPELAWTEILVPMPPA